MGSKTALSYGRGMIKCPFCHNDTSLQTAATEDNKFCPKQSHSKSQLDETHAYY